MTPWVGSLVLLLASWSAAQDPAPRAAPPHTTPTATPTAPAPASDPAAFTRPPFGLPPMPLPAGAQPTPALVHLGGRLFGDPILSSDRTVSCQHCHLPQFAFASPDVRPSGVNGQRAAVHAPALVNRGYGSAMRWNGSTKDLDAFVLEPIGDAREMALGVPAALARLRADPGYAAAFGMQFADGVTERNLATALATFVRSIVAGDAPVDRFQHGEPDALTREQRAGLWLFESKAQCWRCHPAPLFTDDAFHATGVGAAAGEPEAGRMAATHDERDRGAFKTPTLRGVARSAPFFHDGSAATLADVIEFYDRGGNPSRNLDPRLKPLGLSAPEKQHLLAFLQSL